MNAVIDVAPGYTLDRATGTIGAWVVGLDIRARQPAGVLASLRSALAEHGVLFFSVSEPITDEEHKQFGRWFGEVLTYSYRSQKGGDPELNGIDSFVVPADKYRTNCWHTDGTPQKCPPGAAVMRPILLPSVGGDTMWASMNAAYEALSSRYQRLLDGLEAVHSTAAVARHFPEGGPDIFGEGESNVHPVVIRDADGRRLLYVNSNYTERIVGMNLPESDYLLRMLFEHINTPEFHVRLRWQADTVVVWDERATQHRGVVDYTERRVLRRMNIKGTVPRA